MKQAVRSTQHEQPPPARAFRPAADAEVAHLLYASSSWCWRWESAPTLRSSAWWTRSCCASCPTATPTGWFWYGRRIPHWARWLAIAFLRRTPTSPSGCGNRHSFEGIAGFEDVSLNRTGTGEPERIAGARVSANFFSVLGVTPLLGNAFDYAEGDPSRNHVAILSYPYWKSHFGGSPAVLGQTLTLNDASYTVVGVLPAGFHLPSTREGGEQRKPDIWIPYEPGDTAQRGGAESAARCRSSRGSVRAFRWNRHARKWTFIGKRLEEQNPALNAGFGRQHFPRICGRCGQRTASQFAGPAGGSGTDPVTRVREPGQPDADARHGTAERACHPQGARRQPIAA